MSFNLANATQIYETDPKLKKQDVDAIIEWLKTQTHLPQLTELQVILFLHSCYYETEPTKTTIENYFTLKTNSDLYQSADVEVVKRVYSVSFLDFLPKKTPEGYVIFLMGVQDPDPRKFICTDLVKVTMMVLCLYFHQYGPANGVVLLIDNENTYFGHLLRINMAAIRALSHFLQESAPIRFKGGHYVNVAAVAKPLLTLGKPFLKKEIYEMLKVHSSLDSLHGCIPKDCLPEEYGGSLGPRSEIHERNLENILNHLDFFKWHDGQKVDEAKRVRTPRKGFF